MYPILSIVVASIRRENLQGLIENVESTLKNPKACEVLVKIDTGDTDLRVLIQTEASRRQLPIRFIETPSLEGYWSLWKSYNELVRISSPSSYFVLCLNDECRFGTQNWDEILKNYIGYYPDNLFHLRLSPRREFAFESLCEAIPFGESFGMYTKEWVELTEGLAIGPAGCDTGQECVNFFLREFLGMKRGVVVDQIQFKGEEESISASHGLSASQWQKKRYQIDQHYADYFSIDYCEDFLRRATKLLAKIENQNENCTIACNPKDKLVETRDENGDLLARYSYKIPFHDWINLIFRTKGISGYESDFSTWPPLVANQLLARRQFADKLITLSEAELKEFMQGENLTTYNQLRLLANTCRRVDSFERYQIDFIANKIFSSKNLSSEASFREKIFNWYLFDEAKLQNLFALALYVTNEELKKYWINFPPPEYELNLESAVSL